MAEKYEGEMYAKKVETNRKLAEELKQDMEEYEKVKDTPEYKQREQDYLNELKEQY